MEQGSNDESSKEHDDQKKDPSSLPNDDKNLQEIEELKKQVETYLKGWQRAQADYANLKKEMEKKISEISEYAKLRVVMELLPVYQNLDQAMQYIPADQKNSEWVRGIENIYKSFLKVIENLELAKIKTVGEKFDSNFHEAIVHEKKESVEPDIIFEEIQPGFTYLGKTVVAAKVKVAKLS